MGLVFVGELPTARYTPRFVELVEVMRTQPGGWWEWPADTDGPAGLDRPGRVVQWELQGELVGAVQWTRRAGTLYACWMPR